MQFEADHVQYCLKSSLKPESRRGGSQWRHGARLKVNVDHGACDVADAAAAGGTCANLAFLQTPDVALGDRTHPPNKTDCSLQNILKKRHRFIFWGGYGSVHSGVLILVVLILGVRVLILSCTINSTI